MDVAEHELPSGTVTFLFTDIEGSTRLLHLLGQQQYDDLLTAHQKVLMAAIAAHEGSVVDTQGDGFFVVPLVGMRAMMDLWPLRRWAYSTREVQVLVATHGWWPWLLMYGLILLGIVYVVMYFVRRRRAS